VLPMNFVNAAYIGSVVLGLLIIAILFIFAKKLNRGNIYLALSIFSIVYLNVISNLYNSQKILDYPYLLRTGNIFGYLIYPLLYLYARQSFYPETRWKHSNWVLFLPALLFIVDLWPFFMLSPERKIAIIGPKLSNFNTITRIDEGWIQIPYLHMIFRYVWSFVVFIMAARLIYKNRYLSNARETTDNKILFRFIQIINLIYIPLIFPGIFGAIGRSSWYNHSFFTLNLSIAILTIGAVLLLFPQILYGFSVIKKPYSVTGDIRSLIIDENQPILKNGKGIKNMIQELREKNHTSPTIKGISNEEEWQMMEKIKETLETSNSFRNPGYSIHDLSQDSGIPVYLLSPVINRHFGDNFNNLINEHRINYFISLLKDPLNRTLTLEALSKDAGFTSRSTFINAFRKRTGMTPGMYMKQAY
jgi:AraC-like DNA-binding protein